MPPNARDRPSITSTETGHFLVTKGSLRHFIKSLLIKQAEASKSNKVWTLMLWNFKQNGKTLRSKLLS